jgi:hypothetical protein
MDHAGADTPVWIPCGGAEGHRERPETAREHRNAGPLQLGNPAVTEFAAVVLAHTDAPHVRRLVTALNGVPIFLHCDAKTPAPVLADMVERLPRNVTVLEQLPTSLASWSLVAAELAGVRAALARTRAEHIAVLSGSDYPLVSMQVLVEELDAWRDQSYVWNHTMPFRPWDTSRHCDGGMWRLRRRFVTHHDQVVFVRDVPLRWPFLTASLPNGIEPRASSQWKIYARHHADRLLDVVDARPDLVRFWRSTLVPEESFAASILGSRAIMGGAAVPPCWVHAWYIHWREDRHEHPRWLGHGDFDGLASARWGDPIGPDQAFRPWTTPERPGRKLFARKFSSSVDPGVLNCIDAELRT